MWEQKGDDKGRWTEYVNSETGKSSIQEHKLKVIWTGCKEDEHEFEFTGNRELTCKKCGYIKNIIIGLEKLENGKVVKVNL
jgi:hypothetical protein